MKAFIVAMILMVAMVAVAWFGLQTLPLSASDQYQSESSVRL